jgi:sialic acid synthase SpsE
VILSSGVSTLADIGKALSWFSGTVTLLHCVTAYPAPETEYNVRLVHTLGSIFGVPTGISDHSLDPVLVPVLAAVCGARMVEKHITLSRTAGGLDDPVALEPRDFARMVRRLGAKIYKFDRPPEELEAEFGGERVRSTLGDGVKRLAPAEAANYGRTNRSLHYMRDLRAGQTTATADVGVLRTEKALSPGISPEYLTLVTGARLVRDVADGEGVRLEDFISGETAYSPACGGV